jgi:putative hemolysin
MKRLFTGGRDAPTVRRPERILAIGVVGLIGALWLLGDQAAAVGQIAPQIDLPTEPTAGTDYERFSLPLLGGGMFVLMLLGIIAVNALFVAAETAVDMLTGLHVKYAANETAQRRLQDLLNQQQKFVAACSLGSQTARLALIFVGLLLAQDVAILFARQLGWAFNYGMILLSALIIAVPVLLVNVILGELVPKSFATMHPTRVALPLRPFIQLASFAFGVPANLIVAMANVLTKRFGGRATMSAASQAEEQIKNLVETAQESGAIESEERELLDSVFEFTDTVVREVMTPRVDLEAVSVEAPLEDIAKLVEQTGHSRIPIYENTDDQILGVVHAKDLLLAMVEHRDVDSRDLMRPALFLPENMTLQEALREMRVNRAQLAIVQDEFGGTAGIVTTEDIVEELVGDIIDEYDVEEEQILETETGFLVDGKMHLDDVNQHVGSRLESDEFDTIGGFVFGLFGRQPKDGEEIVHEGHVFVVAETDGKRVLKLAMRLEQPEPTDAADATA